LNLAGRFLQPDTHLGKPLFMVHSPLVMVTGSDGAAVSHYRSL
jgi:hypothetical protein